MIHAWLIGDGQWGSTGKGLIAAYLANKWKPDTAICNFGPNAGHTWISDDDEKVVVKQLPMAMVSPSVKTLMIGPGAIVDPKLLAKEMVTYRHHLRDKRLMIHQRAALCLDEHKELERNSLAAISSTFQGTGAALAAKTLRRNNAIVAQCPELKEFIVGNSVYLDAIDQARFVQIESAQGFELGVNSGFSYPYCTCRDITPQQVMADVLWPHKWPPAIVMVMRTFPIRVGDQFDAAGVKIGTSGPVYPDQHELNWESMGLEQETTTVTGKIRRVFTWSWMNAEYAARIWQPDFLFLNFMNYLDRSATSAQDMNESARAFVAEVNKRMNSTVRWLGFGPKSCNISTMNSKLDRQV